MPKQTFKKKNMVYYNFGSHHAFHRAVKRGNNSPCWSGYHRVKGTSRYSKGRTPLEIITGDTPDLTEYLAFGFYDWVPYSQNAGVGEPGRGHGGDEELGPVGVGSRVGHGHRKGAVVPEARVEFVVELAAPDALAAGAVAQRIARLDHEGFDDLCARQPVELGGANFDLRTVEDAMENEAVVVAVARVRAKVEEAVARGDISCRWLWLRSSGPAAVLGFWTARRPSPRPSRISKTLEPTALAIALLLLQCRPRRLLFLHEE